jgi:hypothetical protein
MTEALAILTVKDEGAFLLDWVAWHRTAGFTDILAFSNDCSDGTDAILDRLQEMRLVTHLRNDRAGERGPQWSALKLAEAHPLFRKAVWCLVLDIDEYVVVKTGGHRLADLFAAVPAATALPLTWRMFGNGGVVGYEDRPVRAQFLHAAPAVLHWPWRAQQFKTLFRNDGSYRGLGVHRPRQPDPARMGAQVWIDGSGERMDPRYHSAGGFAPLGRDTAQLVQLNHYALGALESFVVKAARGRANREGSAVDAGYFIERNFSAVEDRSALALDITAARAALDADPALRRLHDAAVAWRHARFAALMRDESWRALFGRILMAGPTRILTPEEARLVWIHGQVEQVP